MDILFVCAGNTCRSCMAEAIFNHLNNIENISAASAGVSVVRDSRTSKNSAAVVEYNTGVDLSKREAVQLTEKHISDSGLILTMTNNIKNHLIGWFPNYSNKIFTLNEYVGVEGEISDPYGGDISVYNNTYNDMQEKIKLLLVKLKEDNGI